MAKLIVTYEQPKDQQGFDRHYFEIHVPLAKRLPNLKDMSVNKVLQSQNTDAPPYLIVQLDFESAEALSSAMESAEGKAAADDVGNLMEFLHKPPVISITE
jgi:uncharacterized protein (TIGR02118 family)